MGIIALHAQYFQQVRPLSECDAADGRAVGLMLIDLVGSNPKDLPHAIRTFANRTAMLRDCGLRHVGAMLARILSTDAQRGCGVVPTVLTLDASSSVTETQAVAIGNAIASRVQRSSVPSEALRMVVESHAILQTMNLGFAWFLPMLEVLAVQKAAESSRGAWMRRLSSTVAAVGTDEVTSNGDVVAGERSFTSLVWISADNIPYRHSRAAC